MTEQIIQLIESVFSWYSKSLEEYSRRLPVSSNTDLTKVPTLLRGHYEVISPMLYERYKMFGTWVCAPYGDWLSLEDMEGLWIDWSGVKPENSYVYSLKSTSEVWDNDVIRLFRPERISAFAVSTESYERVYLMWFDGIEEPELWIYNADGVGRYKNLAVFLKALPVEDSTAYEPHWILGYNQ